MKVTGDYFGIIVVIETIFNASICIYIRHGKDLIELCVIAVRKLCKLVCIMLL